MKLTLNYIDKSEGETLSSAAVLPVGVELSLALLVSVSFECSLALLVSVSFYS